MVIQVGRTRDFLAAFVRLTDTAVPANVEAGRADFGNALFSPHLTYREAAQAALLELTALDTDEIHTGEKPGSKPRPSGG
jgi:hypothetical protein